MDAERVRQNEMRHGRRGYTEPGTHDYATCSAQRQWKASVGSSELLSHVDGEHMGASLSLPEGDSEVAFAR